MVILLRFLTIFAVITRIEDSLGHVDGTCSAHVESYKLMSMYEQYNANVIAENKHCDEFVAEMKASEAMYASAGDQRRLVVSEFSSIEIPVVFHVLFASEDQNLSDHQLLSQIYVLNLDFSATNDEINSTTDNKIDQIFEDRVASASISFYRHGHVDIIRKSIDDVSICEEEEKMKSTSNGGLDAFDPKLYLNIWLCDLPEGPGSLGSATFPCLLDTDYEWKDGVMLDIGNVGSIDYQLPGEDFYFSGNEYNRGRTATHEVGHWLNLRHIWGDDNICTDSLVGGDFVADTPVSKTNNTGCPEDTTNSCNAIDPAEEIDVRDMYENYMDYTDDACMFMFTTEQVMRMRAVLSPDGCRKDLYYQGVILEDGETFSPTPGPTNAPSIAPSSAPTAAPISAPTAAPNFECNDGCRIKDVALNDNDCDCKDCEDEDEWTCEQCYGACPSECGEYTVCVGELKDILQVTTKLIVESGQGNILTKKCSTVAELVDRPVCTDPVCFEYFVYDAEIECDCEDTTVYTHCLPSSEWSNGGCVCSIWYKEVAATAANSVKIGRKVVASIIFGFLIFVI